MVDGVILLKKENVLTSAFKSTQENATTQVQKMEAMIVKDLLPNMKAVLKMIVQVRFYISLTVLSTNRSVR